ncbi:MAG: SDR family oxidoreductase [Micromonosporaceae bacterium]|nr:SDR family oxidoreductase [Micromonosporaceae bacterium]
MDIRLAGRTALVTGAGRNIGRAIARKLAGSGARLVCGYVRDPEAAKAVVAEIEAAGGTADACRLDLTDVPGIRATVRRLHERGVGVDILVNNAAIRPRTAIGDVTVEEWDEVHATNLRGAFFLAQAVLPHMLRQRWGRIVNIAGIDAYHGSVQRPHVVASKLGLVGLGRALANETARFGVTVNTVVPGVLDTHRYRHGSDDIDRVMAAALQVVPMARLGTAEDVASACVFLASEHAGYITGQELLVSGGAYPLVRQPHREEPIQDGAGAAGENRKESQ